MSSCSLTNIFRPAPKKVCILGSGNWGSTIAKIIGFNVEYLGCIDATVKMWVFEEQIDGVNLSEIINTKHENVKYLPGVKLPSKVIAVPDLVESAREADILVFVIPHQFVVGVCDRLKGNIKKSAVAISLIKGFDSSDSGIKLISDVIRSKLNIQCAVLSGANIANEVADEQFCETTIGCKNKSIGRTMKLLFETRYFRVTVIDDENTVECCGALKNVVATAAGFTDGLGYKDNTKAAVLRLGLMEMIKFVKTFYPGAKMESFYESCGVADLVTTCYGGRNRKVAEAFAKGGKTIEELEKEMLNGQKLQGPQTAAELNFMLAEKKMEGTFPLFTAVHKICTSQMPVSQLIECIRNHPEHM